MITLSRSQLKKSVAGQTFLKREERGGEREKQTDRLMDRRTDRHKLILNIIFKKCKTNKAERRRNCKNKVRERKMKPRVLAIKMETKSLRLADHLTFF